MSPQCLASAPLGSRCQRQTSTTMLPLSPFPSVSPWSPAAERPKMELESPKMRVFRDDKPSAAGPGRATRASLQRHRQGRACPCRSSQAPGQAQCLWVAPTHEPRCRGRGGENDPVFGSAPSQRPAPSRGSTTEEFTPSPGSQDQAMAPLALPLAPQPGTGSAPKRDSVSGGPE